MSTENWISEHDDEKRVKLAEEQRLEQMRQEMDQLAKTTKDAEVEQARQKAEASATKIAEDGREAQRKTDEAARAAEAAQSKAAEDAKKMEKSARDGAV